MNEIYERIEAKHLLTAGVILMGCPLIFSNSLPIYRGSENSFIRRLEGEIVLTEGKVRHVDKGEVDFHGRPRKTEVVEGRVTIPTKIPTSLGFVLFVLGVTMLNGFVNRIMSTIKVRQENVHYIGLQTD